jgi:UDP-glucose 4-epimerase
MAMPQNKSSITSAHEEQCRRAAGLENHAWNCGKGNGGAAMPNLDKQNIKMNGGALQLASNRRALGDIGNLVGALSARCIVSKDAAMKNNNQE